MIKIKSRIKGTKPCKECGTEFYYTNGNQKFCCLHCAEQHHKKLHKKYMKKYLQQNKEARKKQLIRHKTRRLVDRQHICQICFKHEAEQLHHIRYDESGITVISVCRQCHKKLHKAMKEHQQ